MRERWRSSGTAEGISLPPEAADRKLRARVPAVSAAPIARLSSSHARSRGTAPLRTPFTYLTVSVALILRGIGLVEFVLQLSDQIILRVHDIQVLVLVAVPFVFLLLAGAADVIEDLPQLVALD